jgi:hypothetical protein
VAGEAGVRTNDLVGWHFLKFGTKAPHFFQKKFLILRTTLRQLGALFCAKFFFAMSQPSARTLANYIFNPEFDPAMFSIMCKHCEALDRPVLVALSGEGIAKTGMICQASPHNPQSDGRTHWMVTHGVYRGCSRSLAEMCMITASHL